MRCFLAITPPDPVLDRLEMLSARLPVGRTPPRENLHLTLAFLDEVPEMQARDLHLALSEISHPAVEVTFAGLDLFGGAKPEILHAAVRPEPGIVHLHDKVQQAARQSGLALKRTRFRPHVTLARFNRAPSGEAADRLADFLRANALAEIPGFRAESFSLYQSELGHGPARHSELARYELQTA
ncbi:RNA 2',3'-cyclic phosphodiesterase [Aliiruegeria sabulilitoris]|uniref:RNA 2',3'-cyclic phosphodiesterase n=1 Tax=Aliiruegeria sabulilitoris TaxID=1510458 RepID=UPI0008367BFC|nr:RNA 2',3'-cyclic phosphodiesterase [Aliiruegeria sabulilitoris]NDR57490.1 RNA 2',3'-cyclic phosphodiesterase [Pseudoruegeria sp. M32A2M]